MSALPANFVDLANERFITARAFWNNWRSEARSYFAFVAGDQWLVDDLDLLKEQKRPSITFNYSEKMIDAVVGAEVSSRQEVRYAPRSLEDAPLAELWTNAAKWARDETNTEDEESDAFRDCLICGLGWTRTKVSYDREADGLIECERVDPLEMYADPAARKPSLAERRYNFHICWVDERVAKVNWPNLITPTAAENAAMGVNIIRTGDRYGDDATDDTNQHKGQVQIRYYECVEFEPFYRVESSGAIIDVEPADFAGMQPVLDASNINYVKQHHRVYYYGYFAGETLLESGKSPCQEGFVYQAITGKRDRNRNTWYGLTKVMMDPQRWANKWLSQILHIINSNAKGGLLAETGAFVDPKKAQDTYAQPESIVFLKEGGISKIKEKAMTNYPQGLDRLMEFALSSLPQVTGINLEALGLAGREQANVLEQSRKQAAYGLLSPIFDSLRRYRKNQGRVLLYFIHTYISDGRLIRIGGPESEQFIPLTKAPKAPCYDIIVDTAPTSPDVKEKTWSTLVEILPAMMKAGLPIPPDLLDYTPLPAALTLKWKKFIESNPSSPQQIQQMQQQMQQMQEEMDKQKAALRDKSAELQINQGKVVAELKLKAQAQQFEQELKQRIALGEFNLDHAKLDEEMRLKREQHIADTEAAMTQIMQSGVNASAKNTMDTVVKLVDIISQIDPNDDSQSSDNSTAATITKLNGLIKQLAPSQP